MRMFMQASDGRFIKRQLEAWKNKETEDLWVLVEDEEEATDDPGMVAGEDFSMHMLMAVNKLYPEISGFTCYTPKADQEEYERQRAEREKHKYATSRSVHLAHTLASLGAAVAVGGDEVIVGCPIEALKKEGRRLMDPLHDLTFERPQTMDTTLFRQNGLPREKFSHRRPEHAYGNKFNTKLKGRNRR